MRARGSIEDATVTPDFEHVLATMEEMHEAELRRVRDKYESEMATFKRFANDREMNNFKDEPPKVDKYFLTTYSPIHFLP